MLLFEMDNTVPICYVDMDGVLADFYNPFNKMAGVSNWNQADQKTLQATLQKIRERDDFWINLEVLPDADRLLNGIIELAGEYVILSKAMAGDKNVEKQKRQWVQSKLSIQPVDTIIMPANADKSVYAKKSDGTPNVLIDDFGVNIKKWASAGGTAIKHKDGRVEGTLQQLRDVYEN